MITMTENHGARSVLEVGRSALMKRSIPILCHLSNHKERFPLPRRQEWTARQEQIAPSSGSFLSSEKTQPLCLRWCRTVSPLNSQHTGDADLLLEGRQPSHRSRQGHRIRRSPASGENGSANHTKQGHGSIRIGSVCVLKRTN